MRPPWLLLVGTPLLLASCLPQQTNMPLSPQKSVLNYGQKVRFSKGQSLQFANFALRFDGQTHVKVKDYPNGFVCENFTATANGKSQKLYEAWELDSSIPPILRSRGKIICSNSKPRIFWAIWKKTNWSCGARKIGSKNPPNFIRRCANFAPRA